MASSDKKSSRSQPHPRSYYPFMLSMTTRWNDQDIYGHMNNMIYGEMFDTVVNRLLIDGGVLDFKTSPRIGLVVSSSYQFFEGVNYPETLDVGVGIHHMGTSSVGYSFALFRAQASHAAAQGQYTHVFVERATHKPTPIWPELKSLLVSNWIQDGSQCP